MKIHAILYSWPSVQSRAFQIAKDLAGHAHRVSVVTCTDDPIEVPEGVETFVLPNSCYFGQQFKKTIEVFEGDVLLQIAADTTTESWGAVVRQCEARFQSVPGLGIWTPEIDGTTWPNSRVQLYQTNDPQLVGVVQTDCIVWAVRGDIVAYLRTLDYSSTPLGWGADWAAIAHAYANKLRVMRDAAVRIHHPVGTGYNRDEANRQKDAFLSALSDDEKIQLSMMSGVIDGRTAALTARAAAPPPAEAVLSDARSAKTFALHLKKLGASRLLDIGGDTGGFALSLRRQGYDGMIYSVEPRAVAYAQLVANAAEDPKWSPLLRQGVGAKAGYVDLAPVNEGRGPSTLQAALNHHSGTPAPRSTHGERVHTSKLGDLLDPALMTVVDAVKISVDSYDRKAWSSYEAVLKAARLLLVEMSLADRASGADDVFALDKFLVNQLGFTRVSLDSAQHDADGFVQRYDAIYCRPADRPTAAPEPPAIKIGAIVTSIGGAIHRQRSDGVDVGEAWRNDCVKSWTNLSSHVVSVSETPPPSDAIGWLECPSKPPIAELLRRVDDQTTDHILLVNADICLTEALSKTLPSLDPEAVYYGRRHEVHADLAQQGALTTRGYYPQGFDYFLMPKAFVRQVNEHNLLPDEFLIGEPWWDYLLPLLAFVLGYPTKKKFSGKAFYGLHYSHEERFTTEQFLLNGDRFITCLKNLRGRGGIPARNPC